MMRRMMMVGVIMVIGHVACGQKAVIRDPTYSANNYKHPNKAAYARLIGLDKSTKLETTSVTQSDNYKQPYSGTKATTKFAIAQAQEKKRGSSYKHPYGL
jgi:hypothetical protein